MKKTLFSIIAGLISINLLQARTSNTPYGFIENKGQIIDQYRNANNEVKYLLNAPGLNVQLKANSFSYDAYTFDHPRAISIEKTTDVNLLKEQTKEGVNYHFHRIDIKLAGANLHPEIISSGKAADVINYYTERGDFTGIGHFQKVTYKDIYPGIDLEFTAGANDGKPVEYNFIVHPGADASVIRLEYTGAEKVGLSGNTINSTLAFGEISETIPRSYLENSGEQLAVTYKQINANTFGYNIPGYDKSQTLIIDPTPDLAWGTYYGGSNDENAYDLAVYGTDIFITGSTQSSNNIATSGTYQTTLAGGNDCFLAHFNKPGTRQWTTYYGGSGSDIPLGISVGHNFICIAGQTNSTTGIATPSSYQSAYAGGYDAFLVKFTTTGSLQFGTYLGGTGLEYASSVVIDTTGSIANIYVGGTTTSSSGMPIVSGAAQSAIGGVADAFLLKFSASGFPVWGTYAGSTNLEEGYSVATDASGNVFLAGITYQPTNNALVTSGAHQTTYGGDTTDYFIEKYNSSGQRLWGTYYGGPLGEERVDGEKLATDPSGNLYFGGSTYSTSGIATASSHQPNIGGGTGDDDGFLAKFNTAGVLQWATYYGGADGDLISGVTTDLSGNVYAVGYTFSTTGIATSGSYQTNLNGVNLDLFIAKFNSSGNRVWATYYGGPLTEAAEAIDVDAENNAYVSGFTLSSSGIATTGAHQTTPGSSVDALIARFRACNGATINLNTVITNISCYGLTDGQIVASATGGKDPYLYKFGSVGSFQANDTFKNLATGSYTITVMDDNGCIATANTTITQPVQIFTPAITGNLAVKQKDIETYTTAVQAGAIYLWTASGGTIQAGQGSSQVQVKWTTAGPSEIKVKLSGSPTSACPDSVIANVFIDFPDHVNNVTRQAMRVYPNPTRDGIYIDINQGIKGEQLKIYDNLGKLVICQPLESSQYIDITEFPAGVYFLAAGGYSTKILKE